jgi:tetratricopeptide (TPR) repeat protein
VHFCSQCGTARVAAAKFCVQCGASFEDLVATSQATSNRSSEPSQRSVPSPTLGPFAAAFATIMVVGILVAYGIMRQIPRRDALLLSRSQSDAESASLKETQQLPPGHPAIQLPKQARDFIAKIAADAAANPRNLTAWDRYGDVCSRAAAFDSSYYPKAAAAYAHVLKMAPDDLDALRGIGNIDFDQRKYDEAIAAYEHYLSKKPDDPEVRTDLGTMLLSSGIPEQAIAQYRKVLETHPNFFEASFNLGIAYGQMNQLEAARTAFERAQKLAPNDGARNRVAEMLAQLGGSAIPASQQDSTQHGSELSSNGGFEDAMERMLRDLPIAGPKIVSVQWPSARRARVLMDNFPMEQMPPFATAKFTSDLKNGIAEVKSAHRVSDHIQIDICDAASGRVMESITE